MKTFMVDPTDLSGSLDCDRVMLEECIIGQ